MPWALKHALRLLRSCLGWEIQGLIAFEAELIRAFGSGPSRFTGSEQATGREEQPS